MKFEVSDDEAKIIEGIITQKLILGVKTEYISKMLRQLRDTVTEMYGPTVAAILFYHLGRVEAEKLFNLIKDINIKIDLETLLSTNGSIKRAEVKREGKLIRVRVVNTIDIPSEDRFVIEGEGAGAGCYYMRGYLEKMIELLYNVEVECIKEVKCRFRGSEYCEYHVIVR